MFKSPRSQLMLQTTIESPLNTISATDKLKADIDES